MSSESNMQAIRAMFERADAVDVDGWRDAFSADLVATVNAGDVLDREAFVATSTGITGAFENARHIIDGQVASGDTVATRLTWTGTHSGEFNGVPATGRPVRISGCAFDRIVDGKVVEHHAQFDVMGLMVQIGAVPVPASGS